MTKKHNAKELAKQALGAKYIKIDDIANIIALAATGKTNAIIFGPAGHGKSEMTYDALIGLGYAEDEIFVQFFGEGMEESRLYGGLNFRKLDEDRVIEYHTDRSFLNKRAAIFEELFDAPAKVLLSLKDTMTARRLRNGAQQVDMKTEVVIALTNRDPREIADMGPAAQALIERFPLQLYLTWSTYEASDFKAMFHKVSDRVVTPGIDMGGCSDVLADLAASAIKEGATISPRTAVKALGLLNASVEARSGKSVMAEDFEALEFIPAFEPCMETIRTTIKSQLESQKCIAVIEEVRLAADEAVAEIKQTIEMIDAKLLTKSSTDAEVLKLMSLGGKIQLMRERLASTKIIDSVASTRSELDAKMAEAARSAAAALNKVSMSVSDR